MRINLVAYFFLALLSLSSCKSKKDISQTIAPVDERPYWVKARPIGPGTYVGIGSSRKLSSGADHIQIAKNQALTDLASEISIEVSGSSLLNQMENNFEYRERFQSNIRTKTAKQLKGYEIQDVYETTTQYWVYYTLDKAKYQHELDLRRKNSVELAVQLREQAQSFYSNGKDQEAIESYLKALEAISDFWNEPLKVNENGSDIFLGNTLYTELTTAIRSISIEPIKDDIEWKIGLSLPRDLIGFQIRSHEGNLLSNIPVFINLSGARLKDPTLYSNQNGLVSLSELPQKMDPKGGRLTATVNMIEIIDRSTEDPIIGLMASSIKPAEASLSLKLVKPTITLISEESEFGAKRSSNVLFNAMESAFLKDGFEVRKSGQSDFKMEILANTENGGQMDTFFSAFLTGRIRLSDKNGKLIHQVNLDRIKGVQLDYSRASDDAFVKVKSEIDRRYYKDFVRIAFDM